jgi:hypothetical protein
MSSIHKAVTQAGNSKFWVTFWVTGKMLMPLGLIGKVTSNFKLTLNYTHRVGQ